MARIARIARRRPGIAPAGPDCARRPGLRPPAGALPLAEDELLDRLREALVLIRGGDAIGLPLHLVVAHCPSRSRDRSS